MRRLNLTRLVSLIGLVLLINLSVVPAAAEEAKESVEVKYHRFYPDFITNLNSVEEANFLQIRVEVMTKGADELELVKYHEPLLRDKLILLFNGKTKAELKSFKGRKALRNEALNTVQNTLTEELGNTTVERVLFTKVVVE